MVSANTPVTGISLNKNELTLAAGNNETLVATIAPGNASEKAVVWSSSNSNIAAVDQNGKVTAVAKGTAVIIATSKEGGFASTCMVTVTETATGFEDYEAPMAAVYPNPNDGRFTLNFMDYDTYRISIANLSGKVFLRETVTGQNTHIDISRYNPGVYLLMIENGKRKTTIKIIKDR